MRRVRTMEGNLIDRQYAVKDYTGKVIDVRKAVKLLGGYHASIDDKNVVETYFKNHELIKNTHEVRVIENNNTRTYRATPAELRDNNMMVEEEPWKGKEYFVGVQDPTTGNTFYAAKSNLKELKVFYDMRIGAYSTKEVPKGTLRSGSKVYRKFNNVVKFDKNNILKSQYFGTISPTHVITEGNKTTFGVELETADGYLDGSVIYELNTKCVYDGSLKDNDGNDFGGEYVTGVLSGDLGFNQLNKLCRELVKNCTINARCGMHVHVNINPTPLFIVNLYKALLLIEDEMFTYVPKSRRGGSHSKCLPEFPSLKGISLSPDEDKDDRKYMINHLYNWLRTSVAHRSTDGSRLPKFTRHPMGDKCGYDKDTMRYCWANFVPALFVRETYKGEPSKYDAFTIEFRSHPGTINFTKTKNWVKLCLAIVQYVENNQDIIFKPKGYKLSIKTILKSCYPKSHSVLYGYLQERAALFNGRAADSTAIDMDNDEVGASQASGLKQLI